MLESEYKTSNVAPKLRLVGSPILTEAQVPDVEASGKPQEIEHTQSGRVDLAALGRPLFQRHEESTTIELFYDLFFVANLANFSSIHEIQTVKTLTSYVGFFCVLWFTWCLTSMYDIRFVSDSLLSRIAKGVHLGIMVGLAVSGPKFQTDSQTVELRVMGTLSGFHCETSKLTIDLQALVLMVSRLALAAQYFLVMFHVRKYKDTKLPLGLISGFTTAAAIMYLGISLYVVTPGLV